MAKHWQTDNDYFHKNQIAGYCLITKFSAWSNHKVHIPYLWCGVYFFSKRDYLTELCLHYSFSCMKADIDSTFLL